MKHIVKQKQPVVQAAINNALSGGGSGGTSDYTDLSNKPSINSITLSGNKTTSDLGIKEVPTIGQGDTGKILKANFNNGYPIAQWTTPPAPTVEYADWGIVHLSYQGINIGITGTYEVGYNGFATIVFNTNYRDIAQYLSSYSSFQGLEATFTITLTRDQQDYDLIYTTLYFPDDSSSSSMNFITTNSNFSLALPVLAGDEISMSISSSGGGMDKQIGTSIENCTKLECFVQKYV